MRISRARAKEEKAFGRGRRRDLVGPLGAQDVEDAVKVGLAGIVILVGHSPPSALSRRKRDLVLGSSQPMALLCNCSSGVWLLGAHEWLR